ncbi:hypothetical protein [Marinimicrococcus flavescens]|uniref:Uncharacterized protein n=1 Tax=Marinimicrococcus flavescens TaxID=3031815 RepID=A0AAP3UZB2_9PROT|nr:hypothetical protein [Marinimicrococcus flavescens]
MRARLLLSGLLVAAWPGPAGAADPLLLEQALEAGTPGTSHLLLDRERISSVRVEKESGFEHRLAITFADEGKPRFTIRCIDPATTRALLDALRPGGPGVFQATGRCRF